MAFTLFLPHNQEMLVISILQKFFAFLGFVFVFMAFNFITFQTIIVCHQYLLSSLIESLISEKRVQHRSRLGIKIESNLDQKSYGLFAKIQPVEFKRVLSNLVNNAVEAMSQTGHVTIGLSSNDENIILTVSEN